MNRLSKFVALLLVASSTLTLSALTQPAWAASPAQVEIKDLEVGSGEEAVSFSKVKVHYTGWTLDGKKFDSSVDRDEPFHFTLDTGEVIPGWDQGVKGMRVGGKRELVIPPELAYGERGVPGAIPANATLKFEVALLGTTGPGFTNVTNAELKDLIARGVTVVDIRRDDEWAKTGVVEGSKLMTAINGQGKFQAKFVEDLKKLVGPEDEVVLICRTGNRTAAVSKYMVDYQGYKKIYNVTDGITRWIAEGGPVVKP